MENSHLCVEVSSEEEVGGSALLSRPTWPRPPPPPPPAALERSRRSHPTFLRADGLGWADRRAAGQSGRSRGLRGCSCCHLLEPLLSACQLFPRFQPLIRGNFYDFYELIYEESCRLLFKACHITLQ